VSFARWSFFALTEGVICITPGPAVLFVVSHGLARGGAASLWANAGILSGNTFYFVLSAFGLGAALAASHQVFTAIQYAGAAYLVYLGVTTMRGSGLAITPAEGPTDEPGTRVVARGFALQAANPKALLFFTALLPQFVDPRGNVVMQVALLAATSIVLEFVILGAYGYLASRLAHLAQAERFVRVTNLVSGGLLVLAGAGVAVARRS
jgi:threonine/homoserine/homoserine lactone efflux protein